MARGGTVIGGARLDVEDESTPGLGLNLRTAVALTPRHVVEVAGTDLQHSKAIARRAERILHQVHKDCFKEMGEKYNRRKMDSIKWLWRWGRGGVLWNPAEKTTTKTELYLITASGKAVYKECVKVFKQEGDGREGRHRLEGTLLKTHKKLTVEDFTWSLCLANTLVSIINPTLINVCFVKQKNWFFIVNYNVVDCGEFSYFQSVVFTWNVFTFVVKN